MGSINISIKNEAYQFLSSLKSKNESFSDIILEFKERSIERKGSKENVLKFAGIWENTNINWKEFEKNRKNFRRSFDERIEDVKKHIKK